MLKNQWEKVLENEDVRKEINVLYGKISKSAMEEIKKNWQSPDESTVPPSQQKKRACYLSAEFLMGRMIYSNLYNMGRLDEWRQVASQFGLDANRFEEIEDAALGNGGLGRLAACFLDSGATGNLDLDGYGIRYKYGLFKQYFEDGFQKEIADDWMRFGDPWSVRREEARVRVDFADQSVWAIPYDMPVVGFGGKKINTLRLWQAESVQGFDFSSFNEARYDDAYRAQNEASAISSVLYPNDETQKGKTLRLKQQYFFSSASLQSMVRSYKKNRNQEEFFGFSDAYAIQLNDTHPTVAIPEFLRILVEQEGIHFEQAFEIVQKTFAYTNHTIMVEAMEKWDIQLFGSVLPEVYPYVVLINNKLIETLKQQGKKADLEKYTIISKGQIHMARLAVYATHSTNGVAALHTEILKNNVLKDWYELYPERFSNKTNGITQRRWLGLCNREYAAFITERIGDSWLTNLDELEKLATYAEDSTSLQCFNEIKTKKKIELAHHLRVHEHGFELNTESILDVQIKRMHEYKRQLLNAFSILDIYFSIKEGRLPDFWPTTYLIGGKAAPGYYRAKGIIKYINEIARMINFDPETNQKIQVLFVQNYGVSYAEKLIPAADVSEQISTAGTEASGTGNMKFMLNGAVTLGTYDGANIEIVEHAGEDNNYIFGARVEDIREVAKSYSPMSIYQKEPRIHRVLNTLIDDTISDGGSGVFRELYNAILHGASWHKPDHYYLLLDFLPYVEAKLRANQDYCDRQTFARKGLINTAKSGYFSSDRTIREYAKDIWRI